MNRLRGKKKNRDEAFPARPSMDTESSGPFRMFGKKKSQEEEEPKKQIDISAALPTTDDFRTSLLMTGLSARFSMLREQDDPKSKIGKASDDSVLMPKRQSRLMDFGSGPALHDIAEIESIKARQFSRVESYVSSDDAASTTGSSVMNRSKPVEGNNLFGGRQKIYKIPAGASSRAGGMGGRALYDDDVALSAFQRWRQAEKERQSLEQERQESDTNLDYDYRRETNSTTSSSPSATRDSTAATSITSQPSVKERQAPTAAAQPSTTERNVIRTRRLYEQGLTQDLQDQQSSAVFRMDTLSRQRPFGSRTPDLISPVSPPASSSINDRIGERRPLVSKASAPNLRTFSPPTSALPPPPPMLSPPELNSKFPRTETKPTYGGNPPLSPPISEAEDSPMLPIQPNDRGKATAMGVFQRPQQYDDSKYAQRQRQLQQGRETPTLHAQPFSEPKVRNEQGRSRSASSQRARPEGSPALMAATVAAPRRDNNSPTFFEDSDDASMDNRSSVPSITPQLTIERPDDEDHPAFRKSALPTPLSICSSKMSDEMPPLKGKLGEPSPEPKFDLSPDSPTLGPTTTGLSGMVRQHLRTDSGASSISALTDHDVMPVPTLSTGVSGKSSPAASRDAPVSPEEASPRDQDFARHLADGARRVRERLTTYVESDSERSSTTTPLTDSTKEFHPLRANGLGILRSKSSRSSFQESEIHEPSRAKSLKEQAPSFHGSGPLAPLHNPSANTEENYLGRHGSLERQGSSGSPPGSKDGSSQPGLKAFRQARREMQKMRELELQQRHHMMPRLAGMFDRTTANPSPHENGPPPAMFNRRARDDSRHSSRSSAGSRGTSEPRDRSGSETSTGGQMYNRVGGRPRKDSVTRDEMQHQPSPTLGTAGFSAADAPWSPPKPPTMPLSAGVNPSHSTGAVDRTGRRPGMGRDASDKSGSPTSQKSHHQHETSPFSRSRNGPGLGSAVSTPNLRAAAAGSPAPPLPPINPRRKNGFGGFSRPLEHGAHVGPHTHYAGSHDMYSSGLTSDEEGAAGRYRHGTRRVISDNDSRGRLSPTRSTFRSPQGHLNMAHGDLPGGMI